MRPDLDNREWPEPYNRSHGRRHGPAGVRLFASARRAFVREGFVMAKALAVRGSGRAIPPGECAITSLAMGRGWVFGATSGTRAHVFAYCTRPAGEVVLPTVTLDQHTAVRNALVHLGGEWLYAGTSAPGRDDYAGGEVLKIERPYAGDVIQEWGGRPVDVHSFGVPVAGEGVACMIGDAKRNRLYGLSDRSGVLFSVDLATGKITPHEPIDPVGRFSPQLILGPDRMVYGCGAAGMILRLDPDAASTAWTGFDLPGLAGRGQYSRVGAWALDRASGKIYAGDVADGVLSSLDVASGEVRVLGKPTGQPHVRALAVAPDGRLYGVAGLPGTMGHLFCHTPATGELRDLGVMVAGTERRWYGYEFDAAVAGPDGRIYFGESDRISHLFVYFPPMLPVTGTEASRWATPPRVRPKGSKL
jgi:hypothetical protein